MNFTLLWRKMASTKPFAWTTHMSDTKIIRHQKHQLSSTHTLPLPGQRDSLEQRRKWATENLIENMSNWGIQLENGQTQLLGQPWATDYCAAKKHRHHPEHTGPFIAEYLTRALPLLCSLPVFMTLARLASRVRWGGDSSQPGYDLVKSLGHILRLWMLLPIGSRTLGTSWVKVLAKSPGRNRLDSSRGTGKNKEPGKSHSHQQLIPSQPDLTLSSHGSNF